jgi:AcrR family transcriptional regulator
MTPRSVPDRILASAMEVISDFGVRRFTVDELARRVGLSRVTIYRHFESRSEVLEAAMLAQLSGFTAAVELAVAGFEDPEERIVEGFVFAITALRAHAVLQRLLRTEPELILPLLTTQGQPVVAAGRELVVRLARGSAAAEPLELDSPRLDAVSELIARLITSLVLTPESVVDLDGEDALRGYATQYIAPIIGAFRGLRAAD